MGIQDTIKYFKDKAEVYDDTDLQAYWNFSDELLWYILKEKVLPTDQDSRINLLDVGGGTGRWTDRILTNMKNAYCEMIDISPDMLKVAERKFQLKGYNNRAKILLDDAEKISTISDNSKDLAICFHNVIGFVSNPRALVSATFKKLVKGGSFALMIPSYYHALYFCNATRQYSELDRVSNESQVRYNSSMPPIHVFEIDKMRCLLEEQGFEDIQFYGFPITLYPGSEETKKHGSTETLLSLLENSELRSKLLAIEKELCLKDFLASRGNNILVIAKKK